MGITNMRDKYAADMNSLLQNNDYERATALLAQYKEDYNRQLAEADKRAALGDFSGYAGIYGEEEAEAMQQMWYAQNPQLAYLTGKITVYQRNNLVAGNPINTNLTPDGVPAANYYSTVYSPSNGSDPSWYYNYKGGSDGGSDEGGNDDVKISYAIYNGKQNADGTAQEVGYRLSNGTYVNSLGREVQPSYFGISPEQEAKYSTAGVTQGNSLKNFEGYFNQKYQQSIAPPVYNMGSDNSQAHWYLNVHDTGTGLSSNSGGSSIPYDYR